MKKRTILLALFFLLVLILFIDFKKEKKAEWRTPNENFRVEFYHITNVKNILLDFLSWSPTERASDDWRGFYLLIRNSNDEVLKKHKSKFLMHLEVDNDAVISVDSDNGFFWELGEYN